MSRLFLPAATNYLVNPSFDVSTATWGAFFTDTIESVDSSLGGKACQHTFAYDGVNNWSGFLGLLIGGMAADEKLTLSGYLKTDDIVSATYQMAIQSYTAGAVYIGELGTGNLVPSLTDEWQRFSITYTLPATTAQVYVVVIAGSLSAGSHGVVHLDKLMLTKLPNATPYFDGDTVDANDSCAWTGDAHESTSTRAVSVLTYPVPDLQLAGTYAVRFALQNTVTNPWIISPANYSGGGAMAADATVVLSLCAGGVVNSGAARALTPGVLVGAVARWNDTANTIDLISGGVAGPQYTTAYANDAGGTTLAFDVIHRAAYVELALISNSRKPDAWAAAVDTHLNLASIDIHRIKREFMAPGDMLWTSSPNDQKLWTKGA